MMRRILKREWTIIHWDFQQLITSDVGCKVMIIFHPVNVNHHLMWCDSFYIILWANGLMVSIQQHENPPVHYFRISPCTLIAKQKKESFLKVVKVNLSMQNASAGMGAILHFTFSVWWWTRHSRSQQWCTNGAMSYLVTIPRRFKQYSLCESTYLLEHAVRLHLLTGTSRWPLPCLDSCRWSRRPTGLIIDERVTMLVEQRRRFEGELCKGEKISQVYPR